VSVDLDPTKSQRPCRKCGCPIALVMGENGKHIPLDLRSPVYRIQADLMGAPTAVRDAGAHVSHFSSCSHPDEFRRGR
jgi:hypothetical protein